MEDESNESSLDLFGAYPSDEVMEDESNESFLDLFGAEFIGQEGVSWESQGMSGCNSDEESIHQEEDVGVDDESRQGSEGSGSSSSSSDSD